MRSIYIALLGLAAMVWMASPAQAFEKIITLCSKDQNMWVRWLDRGQLYFG